MPHPDLSQIRNKLLRTLPPEDLRLVAQFLSLVPLEPDQVLVEANEPIEFSYFIEHGAASVLATAEGDIRLEVATLGPEGMSCISVLLQTDTTPLRTVVQLPGSALCIRSGVLQNIMRDIPALETVLLRYAHTALVQTAQTALAAGRFSLQQRLCRWILMCHDRVDGDDVPVTHEHLAQMLGVRRSGITTALHLLEYEGMIRSKRGTLRVRDRDALLIAAGASYGPAEAEYVRAIAPSQAEKSRNKQTRGGPHLRLI